MKAVLTRSVDKFYLGVGIIAYGALHRVLKIIRDRPLILNYFQDYAGLTLFRFRFSTTTENKKGKLTSGGAEVDIPLQLSRSPLGGATHLILLDI